MLGNVAQGPQSILPDMLKLFDVADVPDDWYTGLKLTRKDKAVIEVTFASVYGERWRIRSDRVVPERL